MLSKQKFIENKLNFLKDFKNNLNTRKVNLLMLTKIIKNFWFCGNQ